MRYYYLRELMGALQMIAFPLASLGVIVIAIAAWRMMRAHRSIANTIEVLAEALMERLHEEGLVLPRTRSSDRPAGE